MVLHLEKKSHGKHFTTGWGESRTKPASIQQHKSSKSGVKKRDRPPYIRACSLLRLSVLSVAQTRQKLEWVCLSLCVRRNDCRSFFLSVCVSFSLCVSRCMSSWSESNCFHWPFACLDHGIVLLDWSVLQRHFFSGKVSFKRTVSHFQIGIRKKTTTTAELADSWGKGTTKPEYWTAKLS